MPSLTVPQVPHYASAPVTKENLQYADLAVIDLAKAHDVEGRAQLALEVAEASKTQGFFYVVNHGYTAAQTERMFDIADVPFSCVEADDKIAYTASIKETGSFEGYKPRQYWHVDNGVHDQVENYSIHRDVTKREHPKALRPLLPEIDAFAQHTHFNVLHPILRLLALGLELPEEEFVKLHGFSAKGAAYVRFMKYYPRSVDDELKTNNVWLKGHTDMGTITVLYSQPVSALQILGKDGKWRWIKHIENALVINTGDTLEFLSGGYYKATIHRVVQPPADQQNHTRLGLFYFGMTDDAVKLVPFSSSPLLQRVGITRRFEDKDAPTMEEWGKARTSAYGTTVLKAAEDGSKFEEEVIAGVVVKHFN
ncbi:Clavaminate synthase-like protein [Roridomyces roridus]|uniref:Clavaminate synthase-like protein n=1 Tax=Roridomyces roridus TaxID=1738132 RepID=A0AAD7FI90_9AGAR|nr:Clavaminate synthase-like protein [Roridomyces roridus]